MKTKMKALTLVLCAMLLVVASVMGTLAYLKSQTEVVRNTFTVGNVTITLDELDVDNDTNTDDNVAMADGTTRDRANLYHLIPGKIYTKDPIVHIAEGSENCFVYVKVVNGIAGYEAGDTQVATIADQMARLGWLPLAGQENVYYYQYVAGANQNLPVFQQFKISGEANVNDLLNKEITIIAYAIQAEGFGSAAEAWAAAPATWN